MPTAIDDARRGIYRANDAAPTNPIAGALNTVESNEQDEIDAASKLSVSQKTAQAIAEKSFKAFGHNPSPEELASFSAIYHSENGGNQLQVNSAISNYLQTVQRFQDLNANDPTKQVLADEKGFFNQTQAKAAGYEKDASGVYQEMKSLSGQAPKLFGNLSPDQIDQYLAPTKRANDEANARLQGQAAARGLAGSSTELNTLADQDRQYKENVLATGLNLGLQQQQQQLGILSGRESQLFGAGQTAYGNLGNSLSRQAGLAGSIQGQRTDQANYLNQLPLFLASANPQPVIPPETKSSNGLGSLAGGLLGAGAGALALTNPVTAPLAPALVGVGYQTGSQLGGQA